VCSEVEHSSVLEAIRHPHNHSFVMDSIPVDDKGRVSMEDIEYMLKEHEDIGLMSVQFGNNEVGTIQPIQEIAKLCHEKGTIFHCDACQAFGKVRFDVEELGVDMMTISAHKIHGPMGIGALYIRKGLKVAPLLHGGGQESGMRSGTLAVPLIVGFGVASRIAQGNIDKGMLRLKRMTRSLGSELEHIGATLNGDQKNRLPHILSVTLPGVAGATTVGVLAKEGICVSMGSACRTHKRSSHVLSAMGLKNIDNNQTIRISPSVHTETIDSIALVKAIQGLMKKPDELEYL
jgi:cysteine desulfurase